MEHYSSIKLRAYLKYEDGLAVLDLKGNKLFRVPDAVTELSEIDKLVLDENNLIDLPASISKLKNLIVLKLDENKLTTLPAEIGDLRELRVLWVRLNQLVGLPTSIQRLTKLKELRLNENKLTELPAEIGDLRELRELNVSYNQLVGLPTSIQRLTKLERLNLDANKLTELHVEIGDLRELKELSVSQNPLTVDARRCALKLREKGVLVGVPGVAGEHSGYFSYIWKFKPEIKFQYLPVEGKSVLFSVNVTSNYYLSVRIVSKDLIACVRHIFKEINGVLNRIRGMINTPKMIF